MNIEFNADEIFEMAEQIEKNGAEYYRKAAENSGEDSDGYKMLLTLAEMEDNHERAFAKMRDDYSKPEWQDYFTLDNEVALYLRAIADGHVFNIKMNPVQLLTGHETLEEILRTAIKLEEDSIVFYLGMRDMVPPEFGKEGIEQIIKEEKSHIVTLVGFLNKLDT